jgi:hypothetical protein
MKAYSGRAFVAATVASFGGQDTVPYAYESPFCDRYSHNLFGPLSRDNYTVFVVKP